MSEIETLAELDPAREIAVDRDAFRSKVEEKLHTTVRVPYNSTSVRRPWLRAVVVLAAALAAFLPLSLLDRGPEPRYVPVLESPGDLAAADATISLEGGGVKTTAVDGSTIWVMNALQQRLDRIDATTLEFEVRYEIDAYVEGVQLGGGYVWLSSYDDGGELLRFDPAVGRVDLTIPTSGAPVKHWFGDRLWFSDADGLHYLSDDGQVVAVGSGQIKGTGLGYMWIFDPETEAIRAIGADGGDTGLQIPAGTPPLGNRLESVREVAEVEGYVWLLADDQDMLGSSLTRFDPSTGELLPLPLVPGLIDIAGHGGHLWATSLYEDLLIRVDVVTGDHELYPLPGRPGPVFGVGDELWLGLYQPGALVRIDPTRAQLSGERVVDLTIDGDRLLCTAGIGDVGSGGPAGPTVVLDANSWIGYGSWSVVQAELSARGVTSCAFGSLGAEPPPAEAAAALSDLLDAGNLRGPFVLVAALDGVHSTRLFAEGRGDVDGIVLVDPTPVGFQDFYNRMLPGWGHPPWSDLDEEVSAGLSSMGDTPIVVIQQDSERFFLNPVVVDEIGEEPATELLDFYESGIAFYLGLSSNSELVTASSSAFDGILWEEPVLVAEQVIATIDASG